MKRIGAVIFEGFELLDLFGPLEMFGMMPEAYEAELWAARRGPVRSGRPGGRFGVAAEAGRGFAEAPDFDILLVPGGGGTRPGVEDAALLDFLERGAAGASQVLSICTGSALLARAGLLDGHRATSNKLAWDWATGQGARVDWQRRARWVEDGRFVTSSGVSAGIDMALAVIAGHHGEDQAREVARWAEYSWNDDPGNDPFA